MGLVYLPYICCIVQPKCIGIRYSHTIPHKKMKKNDHRKPRNAAAVNRSFKVSKNPRETHGREMKQRGFSQVEPVEEA